MTTNKGLMHFEDLWELSEKIAVNYFKEKDAYALLDEIKELCLDFKGIETYPSSIKSEMKKQILGKILFVLTGISIKENIDVYLALKETITKAEND
jgi:uncharacterized protein YabN with tetrapyrrole methylase and pyrophosphatase domain